MDLIFFDGIVLGMTVLKYLVAWIEPTINLDCNEVSSTNVNSFQGHLSNWMMNIGTVTIIMGGEEIYMLMMLV